MEPARAVRERLPDVREEPVPLLGIGEDVPPVARWVRPFVATGIIGGYTTFSALSVETFQLALDGRPLLAPRTRSSPPSSDSPRS